MIELTDGSSGGSGNGNVIAAGLDKKLFLKGYFGAQSNSPTNFAKWKGENFEIPYIDKPLLVSKQAFMDGGFCVTNDPNSIGYGAISVWRNGNIVRSFPWQLLGSGQGSSPSTVATVSLNPAAGQPGFARTAGTSFEFTAAYRDATGTTPGDKITYVETDANSTVYKVHNHVFYNQKQVNNGNLDFNWMNLGNVNTEGVFPETIIVAADSTGKEVRPMPVVAKPLNRLPGLVPMFSYNVKPIFNATGGSVGWSTSCEVCFGVVLTNNTMVRTSDIVTLGSSSSKNFYSGNGYTQTYENEQSSGVSVLTGIEQWLKSSDNNYLVVNSVFFWRPAGQAKWSKLIYYTGQNFPITGNHRIPPQSAFDDAWTEVPSMPTIVTRAERLYVGWTMSSKSLGIFGEGKSDAKILHADGSGVLRDIRGGGYAESSRTALINSDGRMTVYLGEIDGAVGSRDYQKMAGLIRFDTLPNPITSANYPAHTPKGDEFFSEGQRIRIDLTVPAQAQFQSVDWYVRPVYRNELGIDNRGAWGKLTGTGFTNQFDLGVSAGINPPVTNTSAVRQGNRTGVLNWNDNFSDQFLLQKGDYVSFSSYIISKASSSSNGTYLGGLTEITEANHPAYANLNMINSLVPSWYVAIGIPFESVE